MQSDHSITLNEQRPSTPTFEKAESDSGDSSSVFSWHHAEGPRSLRRATTTGSSGRPRLNHAATSFERTLSRIERFTSRTATFYHPLTNQKTAEDVLVDFDGQDDPYRPTNWPFKKKVVTTLLYGMLAMTTSFATSIFSPAIPEISQKFEVGQEVATLGISLFLFGMGIGPLLWGPLSELYGRKYTVLVPVFISACFTFAGGTAKDLQTLLISRFFSGFFGSAPVTNTGGVLGDIWNARDRGLALVGYSLAVVGGPITGPLVGAAICTSYLGWRWTQYLTGIMQLFFLALGAFILEESYPSALLVFKAQRLRHESGNWALHAELEEWDFALGDFGHKYLLRPMQIIATPIGACMITYCSFAYGLIYASLGAFAFVFQDIYGWTPVLASLPFLAELIGILFGALANALNQRQYIRKVEANNMRSVPEARLYPMMFGSPFLAAGIFLLAWTAEYKTHWIAPCVGIVLIGFGFLTIFQCGLNYLIDTFQSFSASAVAANTFLRSVFAGGFPLFLSYQLKGIGAGWGLSVYGFAALVMVPVPYVFFIYGKRIRAMGKWSNESL